jgi:hypothetical protein
MYVIEGDIGVEDGPGELNKVAAVFRIKEEGLMAVVPKQEGIDESEPKIWSEVLQFQKIL